MVGEAVGLQGQETYTCHLNLVLNEEKNFSKYKGSMNFCRSDEPYEQSHKSVEAQQVETEKFLNRFIQD